VHQPLINSLDRGNRETVPLGGNTKVIHPVWEASESSSPV